MSAGPAPDAATEGGMRRTYVSVLIIEALVLVALWSLGRYFGG